MADRPFPIPEDRPEKKAFSEGLAYLSHEWPFEDISPRALEESTPGEKSSSADLGENKQLLKGYWTKYPTYCLIAYPFDHKKYAQKLSSLKLALTAAHLRLLQAIHESNKHYQSRLTTSFKAYRQLYEGRHDATLALLPSRVTTLARYENALSNLVEDHVENQTLHYIHRALEGAIEGRGGYTRHVSADDAEKIVGENTTQISDDETSGTLIQKRKKVNNEQTTTANRLARAESATGPVLYQPDRSISPESGESMRQAIYAAKGQKASQMRLNQLLAFDWTRLSLTDVSRWFNNLDSACEAVSAHHDVPSEELKALCSLMFWTGRTVDSICDMLVVRNFSRLPQSALGQGYITHDSVFAVFPKLQPAGAKQVSSNWQAYVRVSTDRILVPLPSAAREQIRPWLDKQILPGKKGKRLFTRSHEELDAAIDALVAYIRKEHEQHLTKKRLVNQIPFAVANQSGDSVQAAAALGVSVGNQTTIGLYYYTATQQKLAQTYWKASSALSNYLTQSSSKPEPFPTFPPSTKTHYVGTNVYPDNGEKINQEQGFYYHHVQDLRNALAYCRSRAHKSGFTVAFHNAFVGYCIAMLGAITGYRAVKDPLIDIRELDEATGFVVISDKDFDDHRNARLTWAPPVLSTQLQAYARYRAALVRCLRLENDNLPFFFFLYDDRSARHVTPGSLARRLRWSSELPLNANRHYLRTRLAEKEVPGEIIDAFMGHWDIGEEPYGPYSAISPAEFKAAIAPALKEIAAEQGWQVEHVVSPALATDISPNLSTDAKSMSRKQGQSTTKPATARKHDREREKDLFLNAKARLESADTGSELPTNQILNGFFQNLKVDPDIHDWRFVHNRLVQDLADAKRESGWSIKVPSPVVMINRTPAPFTPKLFRSLAELRPIEGCFIDSIRELNPQKSNIDDIVSAYAAPIRKRGLRWTPTLSTFLVGQILFAAARYGGLLSRKALEDLLHQLPSGGMVIRDHLVFDLTLGAFTRRWYADPLSCSLILRYRWFVEQEEISTSSRSADNALKAIVAGLVGKTSRLEKLPAFLESASVAWQLAQPGYLYRWSRIASVSCSWDEHTEIRVRFDRRINAPPDESSQTPGPADADFKMIDVKQTVEGNYDDRRRDLNSAYNAFYNCLFVENKNKSWRRQISQRIEAWLEENRTRIGPLPTLIAQWALAIIRRQTPEHRDISKSKSLRTYVSCIGRTLFIESIGIETEQLHNINTYKTLYQAVVDSKRWPRRRSKAATECQAFHNFLVRGMDAPTLSVGEAVGTGPTNVGTTVNANYITPFELERASTLLWQNSDRDLDHWIAAHVLELGYWSGLRIGELLGLRLRDIDIAWTSQGKFKRVELLCRTHSQRSLKSTTSRRRIPISCLMPRLALNSFVRFVMQRDRNLDVLSRRSAVFLFSNSELGHKPPEEQTIRSLVQSALRQVTGDKSLVFHHLRHSAANNMLMALMAQSDEDPIWDLFPRKPDKLLDISRRINQGLMINTDRRRGILHAVGTLLGHTEPNVTLQSYIHILPWIDVTRRRTLVRDRLYIGLERDVALDSSLLAKSEIATRSWRSRHDSTNDLQLIADHWLNKFEKNAQPLAYKYSEPHPPISTQTFNVPSSPLPSFETIYLLALLFYQIETREERPCSDNELSRIAQQTAVPFWLTNHLRNQMAYLAAIPAERSDVSDNRKAHKIRFESLRTKFFRGHGPIDLNKLHQHPELTGLMPALPRTKADLNDCREAWNGLSNLLDETGRWEAVTEGTEPRPNWEIERLLSDGLRVFMARTNSSEHTMKFFKSGYGLDSMRCYVDFVKRIYPKNKILVEIKPPEKRSEKEALDAARKDLELNNCKIRAIETTGIDTSNWPYGIPSVRLLTKPPGNLNDPKTLKNSYGAWYAQFCFTLLYQVIYHELTVMDSVDTLRQIEQSD